MFDEDLFGLGQHASNDTAASWKISNILTPWLGVGVARANACSGRRFLALFGAVPHGVLFGSSIAALFLEGEFSVWSSFAPVMPDGSGDKGL